MEEFFLTPLPSREGVGSQDPFLQLPRKTNDRGQVGRPQNGSWEVHL